jgi:hypothetical protein
MNERPRDFGEVPGYEFETSRGPGYARPGPGPAQPRADAFQPAPQGTPEPAPLPGWETPEWYPPQWHPTARPAPPPPGWREPLETVWPARSDDRAKPPSHARPGGLARDVLAAMRARNLFVSLALPLLAAIAVGIAAVVIVGANNNIGSAPTAIDAGFPPARVATADFGGGAGGPAVQLSSVAAAGSAEVVAGSSAGVPALWVSDDGGGSWQRAAVTLAGRAVTGSGQLSWVVHGPSGWLAVGDTAANGAAAKGAAAGAVAATPILLGSRNGRTWTGADTAGALAGPGRPVAAAAAADGAGYVIVGHASVGPRMIAAAWYAPGRAGWRRAADARPGALDGAGNRIMTAVTATSMGFTAVGAAGGDPAAWLSGAGQSWALVTLPRPAGAASAALDYVAANGGTVAAVGTEVTAGGQRLPFAAVSADDGATWRLSPLPLPDGGSATALASVTALTAAGGGFTAAGSYGQPGATHVVVWTLPAGAVAGTAWTEVTPQGTGLSGSGAQAITALTSVGATLTGVGFIMPTAAAVRPTIWQSPVRS